MWLHHYKELDYKAIADLLYVHISTVRKIIISYDSSGDVSPVTYHHGPWKMLGEPEELCIVESLLATPSIYLDELQQELFQSAGTWASISTIFRTIRRLGFTRKRLRHVAMQRSDVIGSDRRNERRKFGYHLRGMTPIDYKLTIRGKRLSSIAIMSTRGLEDVDTYEGNINGDIFCDFVERCLVPILQPFNGINCRSVVVMDNASIHHVDKVVSTIHATGAILRFLPPYSPDYNPLEESFSKVKGFLKANELAYDVTSHPRQLVAMGFNTVTTEDCNGYIRHAGYTIS